jgi:hypothetical protein
MYFRGDEITLNEFAELAEMTPEFIGNLIEEKLIDGPDKNLFDIISWVQLMVITDLIQIGVDDENLRHVARNLSNRSFREHNIGLIPFVVAYAHTNRYVRIMVKPDDVVIEVSSTKDKVFSSLKHGTVDIPYIGTPPSWSEFPPCVTVITLDLYIDKIKEKIDIQRTQEGITVRFKKGKK